MITKLSSVIRAVYSSIIPPPWGGERNQREGKWGRKSRKREGREGGSEMEGKGKVKKRKGKEKSGKKGKMS